MPTTRIDVYAETHGAPDKLHQTEAALAGIERQGVATDGALGNTWKQFAAGAIAAQIVQRAAAGLTNALKDSVKAAIEAERVDRALEAALEITGSSAAGAARGMNGFAAGLQRVTVYDDEAIKSAQALMISMRGTTDGLEEATRGAVGLASVFKMDLESAARAVAQGMEGNYLMLGRLIPAIREAKTESEKHAAMMRGLAGFYQRAVAEADTFGGRLAQLKNAYGDLQETIGGFVTKNKSVIDTLAGIKEIIIWLDRNVKNLESSKGFKWLDLTAPGAMLKAIQGIASSAKKANDEYAASWIGITAAALEAKPKIDPLPTIIYDTSKATAEAEAKFISFTRQIQVFHSAAKSIDPLPFKIVGDVMSNDVLYPLTELPPAFDRVELAEKSLAAASKNTGQEIKRSFEDWAKSAQETMSKITEKAQVVFNGLNAIFSQAQQNRTIEIENEYKARLEAINLNITDEDARQRAITALEAEYEIKRTSAKRKAAKEQKAVAMMEAVVNTADAVTKALAQGGFLLGIPWAAIVGALGAIQVATIAAQPIPLATGGYFKEDTVLPSGYRVAEAGQAARGEIVSPVPMMRQIVREETARMSAPVNITFGPGSVVLHAQTVDERSVERIGPALWKAIESQARLRGYRLATAGI